MVSNAFPSSSYQLLESFPTICQCRNLQSAASPVVSCGYVPSSSDTLKKHDAVSSTETQRVMHEALGAFPMVMPSLDIYSSALKKSRRIQVSYRFVCSFLKQDAYSSLCYFFSFSGIANIANIRRTSCGVSVSPESYWGERYEVPTTRTNNIPELVLK